MDNKLDQDKMAEDWADALDDGDDILNTESFDSADSEDDSSDDALAAEWATALAKDEAATMQAEHKAQPAATQSSDTVFKDLTEESRIQRPDNTKRDLDFILDIPLTVSAELGRTKLLINELLQLGQGSVIELNKLAGEPLEIHVNGKLVARGEAVVINEKFGVRLTDIISPIERVKQLG
ncbi:flagellar motor switch protein FliN [Desulfobaculum bizertense]|uniref:Flagellar motor switch protein FliN n=1 Tax=Desulfobaculum bizertense DSM 18034 TaxID=1121442 RepID=A0A1T4X015_9BACT|nr:flagellar motor switch protein FliN [Desulfobaculum bizertense]UIJ37335.1 flagellar motor switch protein FliN [Desulfobaculum bizertense]SKA82940.1 flagellar motor switch protein FliN/FliY [Desulfobaculum bizertense DSM 18034]